MDVGKIVIGFMMTLIMLYCVMLSIFFIEPLNQKIQMDRICRQYQVEAQLSEGLTETIKKSCKSSLEMYHSEVIEISGPIPGALKRGEKQPFMVTALIEVSLPSGFLSIETVKQKYVFQGQIIGRRIDN